jgi:hypothetical protein
VNYVTKLQAVIPRAALVPPSFPVQYRTKRSALFWDIMHLRMLKDYNTTLRNIPEECTSYQHRGASLKSRLIQIDVFIFCVNKFSYTKIIRTCKALCSYDKRIWACNWPLQTYNYLGIYTDICIYVAGCSSIWIDELMGRRDRRPEGQKKRQADGQRALWVWSQMADVIKISLREMWCKVKYTVQMVRLGSYAGFYE